MAGGVRRLPAFYELHAPDEWQAIDFVSDLHLSSELPRTFEAWAEHLLGTTADAVLMLGDVFEAWVGDDAADLPFEHRCVEVLAEAASRRTLGFMVGNRDFLVGTRLLRVTGMMGLTDPTVLCAWGQRVLLTHGDALCLADEPYQRFRAEVRGEPWQRGFLARPLADRIAIAARMRSESEGRRRAVGAGGTVESLYADVDPTAAVAWLHAAGAPEMVHGHTHRPGSAPLAPGYKRHVLSDWDLDGSHPRAEVLRLSRDGFARLAPATTG